MNKGTQSLSQNLPKLGQKLYKSSFVPKTVLHLLVKNSVCPSGPLVFEVSVETLKVYRVPGLSPLNVCNLSSSLPDVWI